MAASGLVRGSCDGQGPGKGEGRRLGAGWCSAVHEWMSAIDVPRPDPKTSGPTRPQQTPCAPLKCQPWPLNPMWKFTLGAHGKHAALRSPTARKCTPRAKQNAVLHAPTAMTPRPCTHHEVAPVNGHIVPGQPLEGGCHLRMGRAMMGVLSSGQCFGGGPGNMAVQAQGLQR